MNSNEIHKGGRYIRLEIELIYSPNLFTRTVASTEKSEEKKKTRKKLCVRCSNLDAIHGQQTNTKRVEEEEKKKFFKNKRKKEMSK